MIRTVVLILALCMGCAGGTITKVSDEAVLPNEVPKDYHQKFEIKDVAVQPSPSPSPVSSVVPTKKEKINKVAKPISVDQVVEEKKPFVIQNRRPKVPAFLVGEKLVYDVSYFGVSAGEFSVEVLPYKEINNRKVYHIKGTATSSKLFGMFYRLNDTVETFMDYEGIFPHRFRIVLDESKQTRDSVELYDNEKKQTFYWSRLNHVDRGFIEAKEFGVLPPYSQDTLAALFYMRTLQMPTGATLVVPMVSEAKTFDGVAEVLRRETVKTPIGKISCVVLKPHTRHQGVLKNMGDNYMWMSDDDRHMLVKIEAKVKIGSIVANLKKAEFGTPDEE